MASLRGIWIAERGKTDGSEATLLFARRFPLAERRARRNHACRRLPADEDVARAAVAGATGKLPGVVVRQGGHIAFAAAVEDGGKDDTGLAAALVFLAGVEAVWDGRLDSIHSFLSASCPFGTVLKQQKVVTPAMPSQVDAMAQKRPAWKPPRARGSGKIDFRIVETVFGAQYDRPGSVADVLAVRGAVFCRVDADGLPDVTVALKDEANAVGNLVYHPCVAAGAQSPATKICFTPLNDEFQLCSYEMNTRPAYPVRGFFQMKESEKGRGIKFLVQLKIAAAGPGVLVEHVDVTIPLNTSRASIRRVHATPSSGTCALSADGRSIVWKAVVNASASRGAAGVDLEIACPSVVDLEPGSGVDDEEADGGDDPFLRGRAAFATVQYKIANFVPSGLAVDTDNIVVYPTSKFNVSQTRETVSGEMMIWNSLGDVKYCIR